MFGKIYLKIAIFFVKMYVLTNDNKVVKFTYKSKEYREMEEREREREIDYWFKKAVAEGWEDVDLGIA